jgi:predicted ABC-type ATPase
MPSITILAGPNGAGKSTIARAVLADLLAVRRVVNAEEIARGLAGFAPETMMERAEQIKLEWIAKLVQRREVFAVETTLAGVDFTSLLRQLRTDGYQIRIIYVWIESADLAVRRVRHRSGLGGQHVDESLVRERYERSLRSFFTQYRVLADDWRVYDNSCPRGGRLVAEGHGREARIVHDLRIWEQIEQRAET